ncbi:hypothetical protein HF521_005937 [Silurus meridionalis]|uniref:Oxidation resistance protein 1 n=1 Tax=Silurus meridionalis TaxID=175797 RepID=A0A8T0ARS0_SILME|nr:hypothetical protein HF521_005937 [Silurus meridionalis]
MLKSLRYQLKMSRLSKRDSSSTWFEGSVEDEEDDDEDFHMVEMQDECVDGQKLENECTAWDVPRLLGLEEINKNITSEQSKVLSVTQIQELFNALPATLRLCEWVLAYRTQSHGSSLRTLYRTTSEMDTCMIVLIKDTYGQVFGAVCSAPLRVSSTYYGTGQTFLFSFSPHLQHRLRSRSTQGGVSLDSAWTRPWSTLHTDGIADGSDDKLSDTLTHHWPSTRGPDHIQRSCDI